MPPETYPTVPATDPSKLTRKDLQSDQDVRWCPGCGDYSILAQVQRILPELGISKEKHVFISGIGCSSRFPYYMDTYGMHSIHGRAPAVATGIKAFNPDLTVWVITGDGDGLSIGGNHLMHALRRNIGLKIILFNNRIYGLTKGQYSPTSETGKKTKSTPMGSIDNPFSPSTVALGARASFVARSVDGDAKHLQAMLRRMAAHQGSAFLEVFQNCVIFNDGAFNFLGDKRTRIENVVTLEHGQPLRWGKDRSKGLVMDTATFRPKQVNVADVDEKDLMVHDESNPMLAQVLATMEAPEYPTPMGVIRAVETPTYEELMKDQLDEAQAKKPGGSVQALLEQGDTWTV